MIWQQLLASIKAPENNAYGDPSYLRVWGRVYGES